MWFNNKSNSLRRIKIEEFLPNDPFIFFSEYKTNKKPHSLISLFMYFAFFLCIQVQIIIHWPDTFNCSEFVEEHLSFIGYKNVRSSFDKAQFLFGFLFVRLDFILLLSCWNWIGTVVSYSRYRYENRLNKKKISIFFLSSFWMKK